jgi:AraC-like DNA-binding protein
MCHILMAVAACSGGPEVQRCHAGGSVSVCSVAEGSSEATAILSSCTLPEPQAWNEAVMRAKNVGLDIEELHKAYLTLPRMNGQQRRLLQAFMQAMSLALQAVKRSRDLEARLRTLEQGHTVRTDLEQFLKRTEWAQVADRKMAAKPKKGCPPPLIHVVCELVRQRPELPLTVKELAAAARLTPNHFTSLFGRWMGQSFSDYLATERIESAKKLLADLTLNVNEIARLVGYDDPGYFARRFRQRTGVSPREWRERGPRRPAARKHAGK